MFGITDLTAYIIGSIIIILLPGPNSLYCLSVSAAHGAKKGYRTVAGIFLGDSILILVTVLGMGSLLKLYPVLFTAIKLLGGLYLSYLGTKLLISGYQTFRHRAQIADAKPKLITAPMSQNFFYRALLLSLTNPKAILFFLSFFVQFVEPTYPYPFLSFLVLAIILQLISFSYLSIMVFSGKKLSRKFNQSPTLIIASTTFTGVLFIGFAMNLWLAQLS